MSRRSGDALAAKRRNGLKAHTGEWKGFIDVTLTDADKEQIQAWISSDEWGFGAMVEQVLGDGYKLSLSPDPKHNCTVATLTGKTDTCDNVGFSLSARGPSGEDALAAVCYKAYVMLQGKSWEDYSAAESNQLSLWG